MAMLRVIIYMVLVVSMVSCQENIDFDLNTEKARLVVDGGITTEKKAHVIKLTETASFYELEPAPMAEGANVVLSDGSTTWTLIEREKGMYYTDSVQGVVGKTYRLSISYKGETYVASEHLFPVTPIDTIFVLKEEGFDFRENVPKDFINIYLKATETKGLGDYYLWKFRVLKPDTAYWKNMTEKYRDWVYSNDEFVDGNSPEQGWGIFGGYDEKEIPSGSIVELEMYSTTKEYYNFLDALGKQAFRGGLFDGPPANVPSNVSNGALGYFWASDISKSQSVFKDE